MGVVFLVLVIAVVVFKKKIAAISFMALFILSTFTSCTRMTGALGSIY